MIYSVVFTSLLIFCSGPYFTEQLCSEDLQADNDIDFLNPTEIKFFMDRNLDSTLTEMAMTVLNEKETEISPLHQQVNGKSSSMLNII